MKDNAPHHGEGGGSIYKHIAALISRREQVLDQLIIFLPIPGLGTIIIEYNQENTEEELDWDNMYEWVKKDKYRMTPREYAGMKDEHLRMYYDLCIASEYGGYDGQKCYGDWYRENTEYASSNNKPTLKIDEKRLLGSIPDVLRYADILTVDLLNQIAREKHGYIPTTRFPRIIDLICEWYDNINHRFYDEILITEAIEAITGSQL